MRERILFEIWNLAHSDQQVAVVIVPNACGSGEGLTIGQGGIQAQLHLLVVLHVGNLEGDAAEIDLIGTGCLCFGQGQLFAGDVFAVEGQHQLGFCAGYSALCQGDAGQLDLNARYKFKLGGCNATLIANINNVLDYEYIMDAFYDGTNNRWQDAYRVFYSFGRTFSVKVKLDF